MRILSSANINFTHDYTEGTVMFEHEGHQYQTSQQPYISDSGETYQASLIDEDGDWAGCV